MRSALFQLFTIKAMTIENIENHIAYMCQCGGVNFALLKSGAIECNKCSTPLDDVKWWAGGMGAQLARAIKAEAEHDALKAALPVGGLTDEEIISMARTASTENFYKAGRFIRADFEPEEILTFARAILAAARTQPVRSKGKHL